MSIAGDNKEQVEALVEEVNKAVNFCAAEGEDRKVLDENRLLELMRFVTKRVSLGTNRVSATAALTLINHRHEIFLHYPKLPRPHAEYCGGKGFLPGVAHRLAESISKSIHPDWPDNEVASHQLMLVIADIADRAESHAIEWDIEWKNLETELADVLDAYRLTEEEVDAKFPLKVHADDEEPDQPQGAYHTSALAADIPVEQPGAPTGPLATTEPLMSTIKSTTDKPTVTPAPKEPARPNTIRGLRPAAAVALSLIVGAAITVGLFALFPAIPKKLFGPKLVDSYTVPPTPEGPKELYSPTALPNTTVRLFPMTDGPRPSLEAQTVNGWLPDVAARPMSATYDSVTFQVWLSVTDPEVDPDTDRGLEMWINATPPMVVTNSRLMLDPVHEGPDKKELNSVFKEGVLNGGTFISVDPLPESPDHAVIYQFQVQAESEETNSSYPCGFNPGSVTVAVKLKGNDKVVVTPYQLYVPRGKSC